MSRAAFAAIVVASFVAMAVAGSACRSSREETRPLTGCRARTAGLTMPTFHGSLARTGWSAQEPALASTQLAHGMKALWTSAPFETFETGGVTYRGRTYASPLFADGVRITQGAATGESVSVVFVATSNGDVYALVASEASCAEGTLAAGSVLWRTRLVVPGVPPKLDGRDDAEPHYPGIAVGTLATPVLDPSSSPPTLYVTAMDAGGGTALPRWKLFAVDATSGAVRPGWPVVFERQAVEAANTNGPAYFDEDARFVSQRSALALSPDGKRVYVAFGGYWDEAVGWIAAVDTATPHITSTFSGAADTLLENGTRTRHANAGMWAPGGPSIDDTGRVYVTTGNSPESDGPRGVKQSWGNSLLRLSPELALEDAYTPFDYCELDRRDVDIAGSSPILLPPLAGSSTPDLLTFGGKAGVVYLLDRNAIPKANGVRQPCSVRWTDAARDASLLPVGAAEPYCEGFGPDPCAEPRPSTACVRGPLQVFGPAGDDAAVDHAKMRTTPAYFRSDDGTSYVYVAGSTKARRCSAEGTPPSLVRLRLGGEIGKPAHLVRDAADAELRFVNPGSPIVVSDGGRSPVIYVVDQNAPRSQPLLSPATPAPVLYAIDGVSMKMLWRTAPGDLEVGGKYVTPLAAHGVLYVATDRLHAFAAAP
ncbi:MAG: hypothetical protein JWP97_5366 [Labilithrix sp.]|nr:hypothetical protein [Labilithrix sp.]